MNDPLQHTRILMTTDTVGGVWTYVMELARALQAYPCDIILATMGAPLRPSQAREVAQLSNVIVYESECKLEWMEDPWDEVDASIEWLSKIAHELRPDLIHLNGYAHGAYTWSAPTLMVAHSCVFSWWEAVHGEQPPQAWATYQQRVSAGLDGADLLVAPTAAMLAAVQRHYSFQTPTRIIHNGSRPEQFEQGTKRPYIFTMGRIWDVAKNIASLSQIADQCQWPIYVAGEQDHPEGGKASVKNLHPLGFLSPDKLRDQLKHASIYALPARYEPFGLSILEAAFSSCALVLGDIASLRELWEDAALFVDPADTAALQQALAELIEDEPRRLALAEAARERASLYTSRAMGDAYWQTYNDLLHARNRLDTPSATVLPMPASEAAPRPLAAD